jgi:hypothetical protein
VGIYKLYFPVYPDKVYIGQSIHVESRKTAHYNLLKRGVHHSYKLQQQFNTVNELPCMLLLEEVDPLLLNDKEVEYITKYNSVQVGYNVAVGGNCTHTSYIVHHNAAHSEDTYYNILLRLSEGTEHTNAQIANSLGVHKRVVDSISCFSNHKYLIDRYPELSQKVMLLRKGKVRSIKSPDGTVYQIARGLGNAFAKKHGLDGNSLNSVLRGVLHSTQGWTAA